MTVYFKIFALLYKAALSCDKSKHWCRMLGQCDQRWRNLAILDLSKKTLATIKGSVQYLANFELTLANFFCYWAKFHCCKWPNNKKVI